MCICLCIYYVCMNITLYGYDLPRKLGSTNFLIILEDTRFRKEGCFFQDLKATFQRDSGHVILREFSMLHAKYWRQAPPNIWRYSRDTGRSLGRTPPLNKFLASLAMQKVKERYGSKLTVYPDCDQAYALLLENYETVRRYWCSNPSTLCHGDSHIGNVFFSQGKSRAGFVDYQCVQEDHCLRDISYYLINSCSSLILAEVEEEMLKEYLKVLRQHLVQFHGEHHVYISDLPSYDEAYFIHRTYALWCFLAWTICCGFLDVVQESFVVHAMQRMLDTCHRLDVLQVMHTLIGLEKSKRLNR
ncbi:hypothetical protein EON63_12715 [archaeon]|nr:MAG: hypothetical protein EON63_12715 [archaeon]